MAGGQGKESKSLRSMGFPQFSFDRVAQKYYHAALMSARAVIDGLEFVRSAAELSGEVLVTDLDRLADRLKDRGGTLRYKLVGNLDARQRPRLRVVVAGRISLECQRCLGRLPYDVALDSSLLVLAEGENGDTAEVDDLDAVAADPVMDVWSLVEDEVLLELPMAPRHVDGECHAMAEAERKLAASPFAVLAQLKQ